VFGWALGALIKLYKRMFGNFLPSRKTKYSSHDSNAYINRLVSFAHPIACIESYIYEISTWYFCQTMWTMLLPFVPKFNQTPYSFVASSNNPWKN
jgi:hypothetical protein